MDYKEYKPPKELAHLIECFWTNTLYPEDFQQDYDYIMPDGSADAIFMLKGNYLREDEKNNAKNLVDLCSFVTPFRHAVKVYQKPHTTCLVIRFRPEGIPALTGASLGELDQPVYPLDQVMPQLADLTMNQILRNTQPSKIIDTIVDWLTERQIETNSNPLISLFISKTIREKGIISIKDFCSDMQIHKSTLQKNFKQITGYTPKEYVRIIRFNFLLNRVLFKPRNLTEICYEMGYFDQSHMIRDFRKMTGTSPTNFINKKFTVPKLAALAISNKCSHLQPF